MVYKNHEVEDVSSLDLSDYSTKHDAEMPMNASACFELFIFRLELFLINFKCIRATSDVI